MQVDSGAHLVQCSLGDQDMENTRKCCFMSWEFKDWAIYAKIGKATWKKLPYLTLFGVFSVRDCNYRSLIPRVWPHRGTAGS